MVNAPVNIVWFKRDLRMNDHRPLFRAAQSGPVLPLYIVEPDHWAQKDMSERQWHFVAETLSDLRELLGQQGQPLIVRIGTAVEVLEALRQRFNIRSLWSHEETGTGWARARDDAVEGWCRLNAIPWHQDRQFGVQRGLASRNGWAAEWDRFMAEPLTNVPDLAPINRIDPGVIPRPVDLGISHDDCPDRQTGGRQHAIRLLQTFLNDRGETYRTAMSSPVRAITACSRLSPHLAWGSISMREVSQATDARRRNIRSEQVGTKQWNGALASFSGRLHWHCHFMQKLQDEPGLEFSNLHRAYDGLRPAEPDAARLSAWSDGETGLPFVDACMRFLAATGWLNFRMRAMLMAVSSYHLWLDWRKPGEHLARRFVDYEPGIHWPQVQMQSGTTGINTVRIYNPVKQGYDQDPDGTFVRRWVPELQDVPDRHLHEPWTWEKAGSILDVRYPYPIIDHLDAARMARRKVWAVRRREGYRDEAESIVTRHGSRRSGIAMTGRRASSRASKNQFSFPLEGNR